MRPKASTGHCAEQAGGLVQHDDRQQRWQRDLHNHQEGAVLHDIVAARGPGRTVGHQELEDQDGGGAEEDRKVAGELQRHAVAHEPKEQRAASDHERGIGGGPDGGHKQAAPPPTQALAREMVREDEQPSRQDEVKRGRDRCVEPGDPRQACGTHDTAHQHHQTVRRAERAKAHRQNRARSKAIEAPDSKCHAGENRNLGSEQCRVGHDRGMPKPIGRQPGHFAQTPEQLANHPSEEKKGEQGQRKPRPRALIHGHVPSAPRG